MQPVSSTSAWSVTSMPTAACPSTRQPTRLAVAFGPAISTAGAELSQPSITRSRTVAPAVTVSAVPDGGSIRTVPGPSAVTTCTGLSSTTFSRNTPRRTVTVSPGSATASASVSVAYSPARRRQREPLSCVTRTRFSLMTLGRPAFPLLDLCFRPAHRSVLG